jgi:hypothetical protein
MTAAFFIILLGIWVLYSGWKFYRQVNWEEPTESNERRKGKERRRRHRRKIDASVEKLIK